MLLKCRNSAKYAENILQFLCFSGLFELIDGSFR
nr:MAG TPA: hypothetical protein [Caudoviricetes sp.]